MSNLIETFRDKFESLKGQVHFADNIEAAAAQIEVIIQDADADCIAVADLPQELADAIAKRAKAAGLQLLAPPYSADTLPGAIDAAQVGVTSAEFAIAETGTLVEVSTNDATRLVSSLPRTHIGIVDATTLIPSLNDAAPVLREIFNRNETDCVVSFLSGPSRTGDIELRLTLGVHGPENAHTIILQRANGPTHA